MTTLTKSILIIGILAFLLWHPVTRRIIIIILPLGRGIDDLIFWILLIILGFLAFVKGWISIPKIKHFINQIQKEENET